MSRAEPSRRPLMTVSLLARRAGLSVDLVRLYLRRGLLRASQRTAGGYQLFNERDVGRLRFLRVAQALGFTLDEIAQIIKVSHRRESPCPMVRETLRIRLDEAQQQLMLLTVMLERMQQATRLWADLPDTVPTGDDICRLIETVAEDWPNELTSHLPSVRLRQSRTPLSRPLSP